MTGSAGRRRRRFSRASALMLVVTLASAIGLSSLAAVLNNRDNHRLLNLQTKDAAVSIASELQTIENTLSSVGSVAAATDGSQAALTRIGTVGQNIGTFSSVSVLRLQGSAVSGIYQVVGGNATSGRAADSALQQNIQRVAASRYLQVIGYAGTGATRQLLVSMGAPVVPAGWAVFGEVPLPEGVTFPSSWPHLDYAVYAGRTIASPLLFASTLHLPLGGDHVGVLIDMVSATVTNSPKPGDPVLLFVLRSRVPLVSAPALALPWILAGVSVLTGVLVILAIESAARRRDTAIEAARDLRQKNVLLDEAMTRTIEAEENRKRLESELHQAQRLEAVGQLAGGIAHDFNNLLMVIQTHADFLAEEIPEDETARADLAEIRTASRRATDLTRRLLVFSRRDLVRPSALDVNASVSEVVSLLRRSVGEDVDLELRGSADVPRVLCDPGEFHQVLVNLVVNARQAIEGSGSITLSTSHVELDDQAKRMHPDVAPGHYVRVTVRDTGSGMTPETLARAFEPYFTTKDPGSGTGLGLSTVYGIVRRYGGYCTARSTVGRGTEISIHLPATDREPDEEAVDASEAAPEPAVGASPQKVLVVEDEDGVRRACQRILEGAGYSVVHASSAGEALTNFQPDQFDLLLTDVVMPGELSGRDLVDRFQSRRPELPVLFMSGYSHDAIAKRGVLEEGVMVINKPFSPSELLTKIGAALASCST